MSWLSNAIVIAGVCSTALAQSGTLDQYSPHSSGPTSAQFNVDTTWLVWQCQVLTSVAGQLEGVLVELQGNAGTQVPISVRLGAGWNTSPTVFSGMITKSTSAQEQVFVDMTSANIQLALNDLWVIELTGGGQGNWIIGSYIPPPGTPLYPEFLYLNGPGCFADCGWRIGFETYMLTSPPDPTPYCTSGTSTHGCAPSIAASANPNVAHTAPCTITVSGVEGQKSGIVFYSLEPFIQPWCSLGGGTSMLCVKAPTMRTIGQNAGGTVNQCDGQLALDWNAFQLANPAALGNPWVAGDQVYAQGWYRDPPSCKTTGLSNAVELTYLP